MKISIFGLGYVGAVSLACLGRDGHEVTGVDIDAGKLDMIRRGISPVVEQDMPELMRHVVEHGHVSVTGEAAEAIEQSDISFICVGTPSKANGDQDLAAIQRVMEQIGEALRTKKGYHLLVVRSTVAPGTVEDSLRPTVESASGKRDGVDFDLCFMPEFLREGASISDYDAPPFTIAGTRSARAESLLRDLFGHLPCDFHGTSIRTAEMLKYASNVFHAAKITFANEMGRLCKAHRVDSHEVMKLFCKDDRLNISPAYLKPGFAFGGSCLPKDLRALLYMAKRKDVELPMLNAIPISNATQIQQAMDVILGKGRPKVGLIGLSFKSGTDDLRESPLVTLAENCIGKGLPLSIYDPEVSLARLIGANKRYIEATIPHIAELMTSDCRALVRDSDILVLGIKDQETSELLREGCRPGQTLLDLVNMPGRETLPCEYVGVCW